MVEIGALFVLVGAALLVAEAHVPAGILGATGGVMLAGGAALAIAGAGGSLGLVVAAILAAGAVTTLWLALATRKALATRRLRSSSGPEALSGRTGVVRSWADGAGQVLVDGALWRARRSWPDDDDDGGGELGAGDAVVVERVSGLTLGVRRAEDWEQAW
jgi:membrane-bound ClpP family serine protease